MVPVVRPINEMNAIWKAGGKVIRVKRPGAGLKGATGQHGSETEQATVSDEKFDAVIENDGTLEDLRARANETFAMVQTGAFPWLS